MSKALKNKVKLNDVVSITDFGAKCDGVTDDSTAIALAVTYCKTLPSPTLIVGPGNIYIGDTTAVFDVPDGSRLVFSGVLLSTANAKSAVIIGKSTSNTAFLRFDGLQVIRATDDTSSGSVGIELLNLIGSTGEIKACYKFNTGVKAHGNGYGFAYNQISLGAIRDNRTNLQLTATVGAGNGYCNENTFFGGTFNHNSGYPAVSTTNIQVDNYTSVLNNNRFFGPSLEDNNTLAVAAVLNGENNVIYWPRMERSVSQTTYQIQFTVNSLRCAVIGNGFGLTQSNFSDLGNSNEWESVEGTRIVRSTPATAGKAVLSLRSISTSTADVLAILDSGGTKTAAITGAGEAAISKLTISNIGGNYIDDVAAAAAGVPLYGIYQYFGAVKQRRS